MGNEQFARKDKKTGCFLMVLMVRLVWVQTGLLWVLACVNYFKKLKKCEDLQNDRK